MIDLSPIIYIYIRTYTYTCFVYVYVFRIRIRIYIYIYTYIHMGYWVSCNWFLNGPGPDCQYIMCVIFLNNSSIMKSFLTVFDIIIAVTVCCSELIKQQLGLMDIVPSSCRWQVNTCTVTHGFRLHVFLLKYWLQIIIIVYVCCIIW